MADPSYTHNQSSCGGHCLSYTKINIEFSLRNEYGVLRKAGPVVLRIGGIIIYHTCQPKLR